MKNTLFLGIGLLSTSLAYSAGVAQTKMELATPTLTSLNALYLSLYPKSACQLEEVTLDNSAGTFAITKHLEDIQSGKLTQVEYNVVFNDILGDDAGAIYRYFNWELDSNGNIILAETSSNSADIKATTILNERIYTNQAGVDINRSFLGLYISSSDSRGYGGAIYNEETIGNITGDFIGNYNSLISENSTSTEGGAIYNNGQIGDIQGSFVGNYTTASSSSDYSGASAEGGAISNNNGTIGNITGDFIANYAFGTSPYNFSASGGAIFNCFGKIGNITGDFIGNYDSGSGGAIYNYGNSTIGNITGDFIGNYASAFGGAIYNFENSTIGNITGDFVGNYASSDSSRGGAIFNYGTIGDIAGDFIGNFTSSFLGGGAVYNDEGTISFLALGKSIQFTGNYLSNNGVQISNAIYNRVVDYGYKSLINFNAYNGNSITVNDGIDGGSSYVSNQLLEINKRTVSEQDGAISYGTVEFNNTVANQTINVYNGTLSLGTYAGGLVVANVEEQGWDYTTSSSIASLSKSVLNVNGGATLSISTNANNDKVEVSNSSSITLASGSSLVIEAGAGFDFDSSSSISFQNGSSVVVDLSGVCGEFSFTLFTFDELSSATTAYNYLEDNLTASYNGETSSSLENDFSWTLSQVEGDIIISGTAVPEPATVAMIIGIISLGFVCYRRKQK